MTIGQRVAHTKGPITTFRRSVFRCLGLLSGLAVAGCGTPAALHPCLADDDCGADVNVCWLSVCRAGLCASEFTDATCNDFKDCTINDHCENGRCVGTSTCAAGQVCVEDTCEAAP